jgi:hypothetical protein
MSRLFFLALALVCLGGCGPAGKPADAGTARSTLERALDAWKGGTALEDFRESSGVAVVDWQWGKGTNKLVKYSIEGESKSAGFDLRFKVKLSIQDKDGKTSEQNSSYTVGTNPKLVVVRDEDASDDKSTKKKK